MQVHYGRHVSRYLVSSSTSQYEPLVYAVKKFYNNVDITREEYHLCTCIQVEEQFTCNTGHLPRGGGEIYFLFGERC